MRAACRGVASLCVVLPAAAVIPSALTCGRLRAAAIAKPHQTAARGLAFHGVAERFDDVVVVLGRLLPITGHLGAKACIQILRWRVGLWLR